MTLLRRRCRLRSHPRASVLPPDMPQWCAVTPTGRRETVRTIFLSYRRLDSADVCDRLSDYLCRRYGSERVFRDTSTIMVGSEFPQALRHALEDCRAMVVVIGPGWLDARDAQGMRRLDDPLDWVRIEVASGL